MPGPVHQFLTRDHARLEALLLRAAADEHSIDHEAYAEFRAGLLRHIAMEEKVLLPEARRRRGGEALPVTQQLRADHAALAALLVPTPTHALIATIRELLAAHNPLEEGPDGLYAAVEDLAVEAGIDLFARVQAIPEIKVAPHLDDPRQHEAIARLLVARSIVRRVTQS